VGVDNAALLANNCAGMGGVEVNFLFFCITLNPRVQYQLLSSLELDDTKVYEP